MIRQCAWCLRLINRRGMRLSARPAPRLYDATHGICHECALHWMEEARREVDEPLALPAWMKK